MERVSDNFTRRVARISLSVMLLTFASTPAFAVPIDQWASTVIDYSSTWASWAWDRGNTGYQGYTAQQALGAPDVFAYGENNRSWSPLPIDGTMEYISLGFSIPVFADSVTIRETLGNGFVEEVEVLSTFGQWSSVWSVAGFPGDHDPTFPTSDLSLGAARTPVNFVASFAETTFLVAGVRIRVDTNTRLGVWEEIDAVQLHGRVPEGGTVIMLVLGLLSLAVFGSRFQRKRTSRGFNLI